MMFMRSELIGCIICSPEIRYFGWVSNIINATLHELMVTVILLEFIICILIPMNDVSLIRNITYHQKDRY